MPLNRRVVIFKGRAGWFTTREFIGDKVELEQAKAMDTCDASWKAIAKVFTKAKTLEDFQKTNSWAQTQYHSAIKRPQEKAVCLPSDMPLLMRQAIDMNPDERLIVYEDLGVTGIQSFCRCPNCGRAYALDFITDGSIKVATSLCHTCGTVVDFSEPVPSSVQWENAIKMYKAPPATYEIRSGDIHDQIARSHIGFPVKILKIIGWGNDKMTFEVQFRDWKTAIVWDSELVPCQARTGQKESA